MFGNILNLKHVCEILTEAVLKLMLPQTRLESTSCEFN